MTDQEVYASFFVRMTKIMHGSSPEDNSTRCEIENIQSGEIVVLETLESFFDFFRSFISQRITSQDTNE